MISTSALVTVTLMYMGLLFIVAFLTEKIYPKNKKLLNNPWVYSLTLAVYCTSWTFYGSVGQAATHGIDFITIYIGPTLIIFTWWFLLKKIVRISEINHISSIADFVSFRYGKSKAVGILVTLVCFFGIIPYISLQIKALNETATVITGIASHTSQYFYFDISFYAAILIGILGAIFGTLHFGEKRKHPGLIGVIAFDSTIKLIIFLIAGFIITFVIFDGFKDILNQMADSPYNLIREKFQSIITVSKEPGEKTKWFSMVYMSMMAVMFLPRQFHMSVVESLNENNIPKAMYIFPMYLFLINIFVIPIAFAGIITFNNTGNPDYYILDILAAKGYSGLSILVYLGGVAASTGMIFISSLSLSNMFVNNILIPLSVKFFINKNLGKIVIYFKRFTIIFIIVAAYFYYYTIGESFSLVNIGLASFSAICIFVPQILFGLFWKRANAMGAFLGILSGFVMWIYTCMLPYAINANVLPKEILYNGLFGISLLKPTQLFGIVGLDFWSHCLLWVTIANVFVYVSVSILTLRKPTENETAELCINALSIKDIRRRRRRKSLTGVETKYLIKILSDFFGEKYALKNIEKFLHRKGKTLDTLGSIDLADLKLYVERTLSKAVGPGAAKLILEKYLETTGGGEKDVIDIFKDIVSFGVGESKDTLVKRLSELNVLLEINNIFSTQDSLNQKLENVIFLLKTTFKFDEVVLREKKGDNLSILACTLKNDDTFKINRKFEDDGSFINRTIKEKKQFAVNDIDAIELNQYSAQIKDFGVVSFCHTPIIIDDEVIGIISTFSKLYKNIYTEEFLQILQTIANQIAFSIYNQRQNEKIIQMNALKKEMEVAKTIMEVLLPESAPQIEGMDISGICIPSAYVGGDYYDYFIPENGILDVVIADVSGHNVASALIMTEVRSLLKSIIASRCCNTTSKIVGKLSSELYADLQKLEFIITLVYIRINLYENTITYTNAGHNPPVIFNVNGYRELKGGGPLLGVLEDFEYSNQTIKFNKNDLLYLYTDGVVETENSEHIQFGAERLYNLIMNNLNKTCDEIKSTIVKELNDFKQETSQKDDITMILIKKEK